MANRAQLYKYRGDRCSHCGKSVEEMVARYGTFNRMFEFHHVEPEQKCSDYTVLMKRSISAEQIEEVDKCLLLCRDCHGIIHAQNIQGSIVISSMIEDRRVSQELKGWFVADRVEGTLRFVSNDRNLLVPCQVTLGDVETEEYFIFELIQDELLLDWLRNIESYKSIKVVSLLNQELQLDISFEAKKRVNVRMALGFPIFAMDFDVSEGNSSYLWLRNGIVLSKEGELYSRGEIWFPLDLRL
ncbi:hypothetical protein [Marinobacterium jannaschii]|uniref:hypothetical protein n=1 Tax=Marinobacterium jannaschii TaxID=64970 RepID=UPI000485219C|nr:hypothetical protein [Marinobacterium jannaschii]